MKNLISLKIVAFEQEHENMKEVKLKLIKHIENINDENLLNTINSMLDNLNVEYVFEFSVEQLKDI